MRHTSPQSPRRIGAAVAAAATAAILAGCGLHNPNTASLGTPIPSHKAAATSTATTPTTSDPTPKNAGGASIQAAIRQYANLWCNWTTSDLLAHERKLESIAVGGARAQEQAAIAAPTESGTHLTNTCQIESLAPGDNNTAGKWVLVTASQTSTRSMPSLATQYHVTYVTVAKRGLRYLVNSWLPQS